MQTSRILGEKSYLERQSRITFNMGLYFERNNFHDFMVYITLEMLLQAGQFEKGKKIIVVKIPDKGGAHDK